MKFYTNFQYFQATHNNKTVIMTNRLFEAPVFATDNSSSKSDEAEVVVLALVLPELVEVEEELVSEVVCEFEVVELVASDDAEDEDDVVEGEL